MSRMFDHKAGFRERLSPVAASSMRGHDYIPEVGQVLPLNPGTQ